MLKLKTKLLVLTVNSTVPHCRTMLCRRRFSVAAPLVRKCLPLGLKTNCDSLRGFKTGLFCQDYNWPVSLSASDYDDFTRIFGVL